MKKIRCAIYTRKSSEEGLEQDFNSLHAQREACSAFILSQASEGWTLLNEDYDDGGLSGGTLVRPGLQRLIEDIAAGRIDIVVVYKVDRLTRSLLDFAKLVEAFDAAGTSFVSVTQSFNTTTSMGRLTLNMLLSFAQFEREVTAERIRDKIAASKAKGMWMGGTPPLGYAPDGRSLAIIKPHARLIRDLFRRYLAYGNVRVLTKRLEDEGTLVPTRQTQSGRAMGGGLFTRGQIYKILSNPIYLGQIHRKGQVYQGKHQPIIARDLWDEVQAMLAGNTQGPQPAATIKAPSPLAGLVSDEHGEPLVASHACKGKLSYRYYVSRALQHEGSNARAKGIRLPALELEKVVAQAITNSLDDPLGLMDQAGLHPRPDQVETATTALATHAAQMRKRDASTLRMLITHIRILPERIEVSLNAASIVKALQLSRPAAAPDTILLPIAASIRRSGLAVKLVQHSGTPVLVEGAQQHLAGLLAKAKAWWEELNADSITAAELARRHGVTRSYVSRLLRLAFLAPEIVEAILAGSHSAALNTKRLLNLTDLPLDWNQQKVELHLP